MGKNHVYKLNVHYFISGVGTISVFISSNMVILKGD